ncbi:MAG: VWA domain-containing protein [Acidobacteriota bacterium]|nr:VWA domain-containing protein [Acidobacteriota bacterium]
MRQQRQLKISFGILVLILISAFSAFAQTPQTTPPPVVEDNDVIRVESRLVIVPVSVTDSKGQPVTNLGKEDFVVTEENRPQEIAQVSDAEKVPLEIALLFDVSASTDAMFKFQQETAAQFLRDVMRPDDRATIFTIGGRPVMVQARDTAEKSAYAIKMIAPTKQFTAFYDTVGAAADYLRAAPQGRRKVIVVISDGEDTNSVRVAKAIQDGYKSLGKKIDTLDSKSLYQFTVARRNEATIREQSRVLQSLQNADAVFYSINPAGSSYQLNKISQFGQSNLQKFADETGGAAFLPKFQPTDLKDGYQNSANTRLNQETLTRIFRQLANELQAQYLVQYYSEADFPNNKYVKLNVGLRNPQNYRLRARQGYFVKK